MPVGVVVAEVVSGRQRGADLAGEAWAAAHGIRVQPFPADWERFGPSAGPRRNALMATYGDALLLFWDGVSPGSRDMLAQVRRRGKPHWVEVA